MSNLLILDIETRYGTPEASREDVKVPATYKKPESIEKYIDEHMDEAWRKQALNRYVGKICCISIEIPDLCIKETRTSSSERVLILWLDRFLHHHLAKNAYGTTWVTAFGEGFDLPWIALRALKYKAKFLYRIMPKTKFSDRSVDILKEFLFTDYKSAVSMKKLLNYFGLEGKYDDLDGSKVHDLFVSRDFETIAMYCAADVSLALELYYILKDN